MLTYCDKLYKKCMYFVCFALYKSVEKILCCYLRGMWQPDVPETDNGGSQIQGKISPLHRFSMKPLHAIKTEPHNLYLIFTHRLHMFVINWSHVWYFVFSFEQTVEEFISVTDKSCFCFMSPTELSGAYCCKSVKLFVYLCVWSPNNNNLACNILSIQGTVYICTLLYHIFVGVVNFRRHWPLCHLDTGWLPLGHEVSQTHLVVFFNPMMLIIIRSLVLLESEWIISINTIMYVLVVDKWIPCKNLWIFVTSYSNLWLYRYT